MGWNTCVKAIERFLPIARVIGEIEDEFTYYPTNENINGIYFPELKNLVEDFAKNNNLKLVKMIDFDVRQPNVPLSPRESADNSGKILQFKEGLAVAACSFDCHPPGRLCATYGGGPEETYSATYILSGELKKRNIKLVGNIMYARGCEQIIRESQITCGVKHLEWTPKGMYRKTIYRLDNENFWFIREPNTRKV